jgi:hypothetical protein
LAVPPPALSLRLGLAMVLLGESSLSLPPLKLGRDEDKYEFVQIQLIQPV